MDIIDNETIERLIDVCDEGIKHMNELIANFGLTDMVNEAISKQTKGI